MLASDDASASWNGFMYQGKVALLLVMELINNLNYLKIPFDHFWVEVEGFEDFSLGYNDIYISIHQVKNYSDGKYSKYEEALLKLVDKIRTHDKKAFLHTRVKLDNTNLKKILPTTFKNPTTNFISNCAKELNNIDSILDQIFDQLKKSHKGKSNIRKKILSTLKKNNPIDLTENALSSFNRTTLRKHVIDIIILAIAEEKKSFIFSKSDLNLLFENLKIYKYSDDSYAKTSEEIYSLLLNEFNKFWGDSSKSRSLNFKSYYIHCLNIINNTITKSAESSSRNNKISLHSFTKILSNPNLSVPTEEMNLLQLKAKFEKIAFEFCSNICDFSECPKCSLDLIVSSTLSSDLETFKSIIQTMALDSSDDYDFSSNTCEPINKTLLNDVLFNSISSIDCKFFINQNRILSSHEINNSFEYIMASTIKEPNRVGKISPINKIISNPISEHVLLPSTIIESQDLNLMEVDKIITENMDISDIFSFSNKITNIQPSDLNDDSTDGINPYDKFTNTKKVDLISIKEAVKKYGGRK